jgi:hypothetical protein
MKRAFVFCWILIVLSGCSEEPRSFDFYMNNPTDLEAKIKECNGEYRTENCLNAKKAKARKDTIKLLTGTGKVTQPEPIDWSKPWIAPKKNNEAK